MLRIKGYESLVESEFRGDRDLMLLCTGSAFEGVVPPSLTGMFDDSISPNADLSCLHVLRKWTIDEPMPPPSKIKESSDLKAGVLPAELKRSSEEAQLSLAHYIKTDVPGKVKIKLRTISKELSKYAVKESGDSNDHYISTSLLGDKVQSILADMKSLVDISESFNDMDVGTEAAASSGQSKTAWGELNTPSEVTADEMKSSEQKMSPIVFGFPCPSWPSIASEWKERRRRHEWPDTSDVSAVASGGCHLVAPAAENGTTNPPDHTLWDVSFALAERSLICSLYAAQRKAYVVLLTLFHRHLSCPTIITPEHIKHVVFWTCEQSTISIWREDNMAECLLLLLDRLLHYLCDRNLPNYFLPDQNLIKDISSEDILSMVAKVSFVRRCPVEALNASFEQLKVADGATYEELFKAILIYMENHPEDEHPLDSIVQSAFTIGHMFLSLDNKDQALVLFEEGCELMLQIAQPDQRSLSILQLTAWLYVQTGLLEKAIEYYEIIVSISRMESTVEGFNFQTCLSNLACLYHVKSLTINDGIVKDHLLDKARGCFEVAMNQENSIQTVIHYSMFLIKHKQEDKALKILLDAHSSDGDINDRALWSQVTNFIEMEAETLDEDLASEVKDAGELDLPSVVLTQYLISKCLIIMKMRKQAKESNRALSRLCRSDMNERQDISWMLLGYCFKSLEDYHSAMKAFDSSMKSNRYYTLAEEQYDICKAHIKDDSESDESED